MDPKLDLSTFPISSFRAKLFSWYQKHARPLPWRTLWKKHQDPYHVWVSEIMLQQTIIKVVEPVYQRFFDLFPTISDFAGASTEEVQKAVRGLGYYRRFSFMHKAAKDIISKKDYPKNYQEWRKVSGIGDYTAAAIASITLGERVGVVDGNVARVLCRLFNLSIPVNTPAYKKHFRTFMDLLVKEKSPGDLNQAVMELGQVLCAKEQPHCVKCPVNGACQAYIKRTTHLVPLPKIKSNAPEEVFLKLTILKNKTFLGLYRRPPSARFLAGSLGFLTFTKDRKNGLFLDGKTDGKNENKASIFRNINTLKQKKIGSFRHTITHHRLNVEVSIIDGFPVLKAPSIEWVPIDKIDENLLSNLDRKASKFL